jgi:hypothetical protein
MFGKENSILENFDKVRNTIASVFDIDV